jgi:hypothetical protein
MSWNHRVVRHTEGKEKWYAIHEVYYNEKGQIHAMTSEPVLPAGSSMLELRKDFELMMSALEQPPIKYERKFATSPWSKKIREIAKKVTP